eukprot:15458869-Alexandrium_andersonii.AAC.1
MAHSQSSYGPCASPPVSLAVLALLLAICVFPSVQTVPVFPPKDDAWGPPLVAIRQVGLRREHYLESSIRVVG